MKQCPLKFAPVDSPHIPDFGQCVGEECAWFVTGACAIALIAQILRDQAQKK